MCHCNHTCRDLLFIHVCSEPTEMHCNTGLGKCTSHCSVLLGKTGTQQGCVSLQSHLWRFDLSTGMQSANRNALQCWSGQMHFPLFSAARQNRHTAGLCVTAITPVEICSSYMCAVSQQKCTAMLVWANAFPTFQCC